MRDETRRQQIRDRIAKGLADANNLRGRFSDNHFKESAKFVAWHFDDARRVFIDETTTSHDALQEERWLLEADHVVDVAEAELRHLRDVVTTAGVDARISRGGAAESPATSIRFRNDGEADSFVRIGGDTYALAPGDTHTLRVKLPGDAVDVMMGPSVVLDSIE